MGGPLLVVEDAFVARGPGVVVMPRLTDDGRAQPFQVRLVRPDGTAREVKATLDVAHVRGALAPWAMVRLHGLAVDDVPPGTEIWDAPAG